MIDELKWLRSKPSVNVNRDRDKDAEEEYVWREGPWEPPVEKLTHNRTPPEILSEIERSRKACRQLRKRCTKPRDREIVKLKRRGFSEEEIGEQLGLSRDQVWRVLDRVYTALCDDFKLKRKPMGRKKRRGDP
ncbi:MAG: helix-turn-helix domain-containing protein [Planctomycetota bacterium]|jgi:DNA-binding CsgD family transcriptional regulator